MTTPGETRGLPHLEAANEAYLNDPSRWPALPSERRGRVPVDSLANRLMLARALAGHLSIREAADLCGLGRGAWTKWERGTRPTDLLEIVPIIAEKLDVDEAWLLRGGPLESATRRPVRRNTRRGRDVAEPMVRYVGLTESMSAATRRPRDNRPPSRKPSVDSPLTGRTYRLPRP
jgi:transcriptional regulator with XRE-family HTH domain